MLHCYCFSIKRAAVIAAISAEQLQRQTSRKSPESPRLAACRCE